jgi:hypothetical protein
LVSECLTTHYNAYDELQKQKRAYDKMKHEEREADKNRPLHEQDWKKQ